MDFYSRVLDFQVVRAEEDYVELRSGTVVLGLGPPAWLADSHFFRPEIESARKGVGVEVVIEVDDVEASLERVINAGHPLESSLIERPWGLWGFRVADPDGYYLRISSSA